MICDTISASAENGRECLLENGMMRIFFLEARHMTQDDADLLADDNVYYMMW